MKNNSKNLLKLINFYSESSMKPKLTFLISLPRCGSLALSHLCASPSCITFHEGLLQKCFTVTRQGVVELNEAALFELEKFLIHVSHDIGDKNIYEYIIDCNIFITDTSVLMFQLSGNWDIFIQTFSSNFDLQFIVNCAGSQRDKVTESFSKLIPEKGSKYWKNSAGSMAISFNEILNEESFTHSERRYIYFNTTISKQHKVSSNYNELMKFVGSLDFLDGSNPEYQQLYTDTKINTLLNSYQSLTAEHLRETLTKLEQQ